MKSFRGLLGFGSGSANNSSSDLDSKNQILLSLDQSNNNNTTTTNVNNTNNANNNKSNNNNNTGSTTPRMYSSPSRTISKDEMFGEGTATSVLKEHHPRSRSSSTASNNSLNSSSLSNNSSLLGTSLGTATSSTSLGTSLGGRSRSSSKPTKPNNNNTTSTSDVDSKLRSFYMNHNAKVQLIEYIVQKRVDNLDYIRKFHEGKIYWFNTVQITIEDINKYYPATFLQKRLQQWCCLGISLSNLLQLDTGIQFIRACAQLLEEYEYEFSNVAVQGMKMLKAIALNNWEEESLVQKNIKPTIHKMNGNVVYEFLKIPNIPCDLDYRQVVFSLCDVLTFVYRKFMDESTSSNNLHEYIIKLDKKFKNSFIALICKEMSTLAMHIVKSKLSNLEKLMFTPNYQQALNSSELVIPQMMQEESNNISGIGGTYNNNISGTSSGNTPRSNSDNNLVGNDDNEDNEFDDWFRL
ncbi:hypothetical protein ABK040_011600 [Willaertia magna]